MDNTLVTAIIVGIITATPGLVALFRQIKKDKSDENIAEGKLADEKEKTDLDAVTVIRDSALSLVKPLKDKIEELKLELVKVTEQLKSLEEMLNQKDDLIHKLEDEINKLRCETQELIKQIDKLISENLRLKQLLDEFIKNGKQ